MKAQVIIIIILVTCTLFLIIPNDKSQNYALTSPKHPQEYMSKVVMQGFTKEGALKNEVSTEYWAYLPENQSSELTAPHLIVHKPDQTVWHIQAKKGKITQPTVGTLNEIELFDEVSIKRPGNGREVMPLQLETSVLRYQPKTHFAETDQFITMTKPDLKITGVGMKAFLDKSYVEMLHDVKTYYDSTIQ